MFIVFEGIDGSGKTTISKKLLSDLEDTVPCLWLREPGDSVWGRKIRELARTAESIPIEEELEYFIKDRRHNVASHIRPALSQKRIVILDRYYYSTACYQGARGMDMNAILETNRTFAPEPDIIFLIDVTVETALSRISLNRSSRARLFEKKDFLTLVRGNYLKLKEKNLKIINGNNDADTVYTDVVALLPEKLRNIIACRQKSAAHS